MLPQHDSQVNNSYCTIQLWQFLGFIAKMIHFALHDRFSFEIHNSRALGDCSHVSLSGLLRCSVSVEELDFYFISL